MGKVKLTGNMQSLSSSIKSIEPIIEISRIEDDIVEIQVVIEVNVFTAYS